MRAYIKLWGSEYELRAVDWINGQITSVSFYDENNKHYTIFQKRFVWNADAEQNRDSDKLLHSDFNKTIIWKQNNPPLPE